MGCGASKRDPEHLMPVKSPRSPRVHGAASDFHDYVVGGAVDHFCGGTQGLTLPEAINAKKAGLTSTEQLKLQEQLKWQEQQLGEGGTSSELDSTIAPVSV